MVIIGCFESYASIKSLKKRVETCLKLKKNLNGIELIQILKENKYKSILNPLMDDYIDYLSIGISNLVNIFLPEIVCLRR